ncbi:MAG: Rab family GTPase [Candidatus Helarchaeota archaeon]
MVEEEILKGVVYSKFENVGPIAVSWHPEVEPNMLKLIALKSITLLTGEEGDLPDTTAVVPFPNLSRSGLVKYMEIKDPKARGGYRDSSITLIFDDKYNSVIYKYMNNLDELLNKFSKKIIELEEKKSKNEFKNVMKEFFHESVQLLSELQQGEEREQFPTQELVVTPPKTKFRYKIIFVGDPTVGKTTLILRYVDQAFKKLYVPTIGVQTSAKLVRFGDVFIELIIWDIAGQEKFNLLRKLFYDGADGVVFVFDLTNRQTFVNIANWYKDILNNLNRKWTGLILGNKVDLEKSRVIGPQAGKVLAEKTGLEYLETSARTGQNVDKIFKIISRKILERS